MTRKEALELENKCDKLMAEYIKEGCCVSLALTGKLKIEFDDNYITLNRKRREVDYINYIGYYDDLIEIVNQAFNCIEDYEDDFNKLIWSYEHITELE